MRRESTARPIDSDLGWRLFEGTRNRLTMPTMFVLPQIFENFLLSIGKANRIFDTPKLRELG